jgi:hypothetical protein
MSLLSILKAIPEAIGKLVTGAHDIIDQAVTDKDEKNKLKHEIEVLARTQWTEVFTKTLEAQSKIIVTEAQGGLLQRNWRPLTMLAFVAYLFAMLFGAEPPTMEAPQTEIAGGVLDIIKIGLGGYVIGRSGEKIASVIGNKKAS